MTSTALAILNQNRPALPEHLQKKLEEQANIHDKQTTPTLSYEGKVWTIALGGQKTKLMRTNKEGDQEPVPVFRGVILDWNQDRGRAYYKGEYDPAKIAAPTCWSEDSKVPFPSLPEKATLTAEQLDAGAPHKVHPTCTGCPMSEKGSKMFRGKPGVACAMHRMVAVVPTGRYEFEPLRLKLAITSDWDGQSPDHTAANWYAFRNYMDVLRASQVPHTAMLSTKMKFDPNTEYPKVLFAVDRWLSPEEIETTLALAEKPEVKGLLKGTWTPNGPDGTKQIAAPVTPAAGTQMGDGGAQAAIDKAAAETAAAAAAAAAKAEEEKAAKAAERARKKAEKDAKEAADKAAAEAAAKAAAPAADEDDTGDDGMGNIIPPGDQTSPAAQAAAAAPVVAPTKEQATTAAAPPAAPPTASTAVPDKVAALLASNWDD